MDTLIIERIIGYQNYMEGRVKGKGEDLGGRRCIKKRIVKNIYCDCDTCRLTVPGSLSCYGVFERILR